jgi:molybdenum cofactor biosynthesis protein MoaC
MFDRLSILYPGLDKMPWEVWSSEDPTTLRSWLKILVGKWLMHSDNVLQGPKKRPASNDTQDHDVKKVLDQMVRDGECSDFNEEVAASVARCWHKAFEPKGVTEESGQTNEDSLDWNEFDAELEWLRDEVDRTPDGKLNWKEVANMPSPVVPEDVPVKEHAGLTGTNMRRRNTHRLAPASRRSYSTSAQPPPRLDQERATKDASSNEPKATTSTPTTPSLPHLTSSGSAHMVSVASKSHTVRTAIAVGTVYFSNPTPLSLIRSNSLKKGDVLSVSRLAGIMAAKKCPDLVPLCHPIMLTHVGVELYVFDCKDGGFGGVAVEAKVQCEGQTGVEMEALTAVMGSTLSVVDMCKAVDKGMRIDGVRVVLKEGGRSGLWKEGEWKSASETT